MKIKVTKIVRDPGGQVQAEIVIEEDSSKVPDVVIKTIKEIEKELSIK